MKAEVILRLVSGALQDIEPGIESRWPWQTEEERIGLMDFLNAALRAIAMQRPDCRAITETIRLEPGMRQRIPEKKRHLSSCDATGFCALVRNMGTDGDCPGAAIMPAQPDVLMAWADMERPKCRVETFAYDRTSNGHIYYVCPPVPEDVDVWVEATYYAAPDVITCPEQEIGIHDDYAQAVVHHMLASILSGDNEASNANKAAYHMQRYTDLIGIKTQVDSAWPKAKNTIGGVV